MDLEIPDLQVSSAPDTSNTTTPVTPPVQDDGLLNPFLNNIPEQDRPIVAKYAKDWDAGVTRKFQSYTDQLNPYKELGTAEEFKVAMELVSLLQADPQKFYTDLAEALGIDNMSDNGSAGAQNTPPVSENNGGQETNPFQAEFDQLKQAYTELSQKFEQSQTAQTEAQQLAELDKYLVNLHNTHGSFDDDFVLLRMSRGVDAETAIKEYEKMIEDGINSRRKAPAPAIIPGAGGIPNGQVDPSKLNSSQKQAFIAAQLAAVNNQ